MPAPAFRVAKMLDVLSLLVPAELSLILSFLLRGGGFRRRLFHAKQFSLKTHGFCRGFLALMPAPAFRVAKMLDVLSLLVPAELSLILSFLLRGGGFRRRLFHAKQFSLKTHGFCRGFLALMPAPAFRVAKMQDVLSLPKKSIIHTELHRIGSDRPTYPAIIPTVLTNRLFYACSHFDYKLCCLHPIILVSNNYLICLCSKEIPPLLFSLKKLAQKIDKRNKTAYHMSRSSYE